MAKRTYIWCPETRKLVEKSEYIRRFSGMAMGDISEFVTMDGAHISSRSHLREYQRRTGFEQIGNETVNPLDEQGRVTRQVQELPPATADVVEAMKKHGW